jgi:hypothetical protein
MVEWRVVSESEDGAAKLGQTRNSLEITCTFHRGNAPLRLRLVSLRHTAPYMFEFDALPTVGTMYPFVKCADI